MPFFTKFLGYFKKNRKTTLSIRILQDIKKILEDTKKVKQLSVKNSSPKAIVISSFKALFYFKKCKTWDININIFTIYTFI